MSDADLIRRIRVAMARLGQPIDDLNDDEVRSRAVGLTRGSPKALASVANVLESDPNEDELFREPS